MPSNLPSLSPTEVVRMLKRAGFEETRQKGSHLILVNPETGKRVTIPMYKGKDIKKPLLRKIIELEAQMSLEQFLRLR
jgi:predicted RNA binding protein YcfA (HicA-like mRNA interferase family)